ncbi:MAG: serine/threonine-protein kinase [Minicystis sp.]
MPPELRAHAGREGRYVVGDEIASGGMATVHLGRMLGDAGFARTVAIKRLHPQYAKDPEFAAMLLDEGRLASRIQHVNVVPTLDVVATPGDLFVVMEYVHGEPLNALLRTLVRKRGRIPPRIAAAILAGALRGLHAAHEARDHHGRLLGVVHRDVSPQNIMVGADGVTRVLDFGIAKAAGRAHSTQTGQIKGKFAYMPPEQLHGEELDRRADVYAAGVVLWESLVGARLFAGTDQAPNLARLLDPKFEPPSARVPGLGRAYDEVARRALSRDREARFATALEMAEAIESSGPVAPPAEIGSWVEATAGDALAERARRIAAIEQALAQKIRDSRDYLDALEETVTDVIDLPLPPLPPAWMERMAKPEAPAAVAATASTGAQPVSSTGPVVTAVAVEPEAAPPSALAEAVAPPPARAAADSEPTTVPSAAASSRAGAAPPQAAVASPRMAASSPHPTDVPAPIAAMEPPPAPPRGPAPPRPAVVWGALATAGVTLVILTAALVGRGRPTVGPAATAPLDGTSSTAITSASAPAATASASPSSAPAAASSSAPVPASASAPATAAPSASASSSARPSAAPRGARPRAQEASCSPPFTIDAQGHKHYKRECLR